MCRCLALRTHLIELDGEATRGNLISGFCTGETTTNDDQRVHTHRPTASSSTVSSVSTGVSAAGVPANPLPCSGATTAGTASWYLHVGHCRVTPFFFVCFSSIYAAAHCGQEIGRASCRER